jgi:hypothetical protein
LVSGCSVCCVPNMDRVSIDRTDLRTHLTKCLRANSLREMEPVAEARPVALSLTGRLSREHRHRKRGQG